MKMKLRAFFASLAIIFAAISSDAQLYVGGKVGYHGGKSVANQSIENILPKIRMHHGVTGGAILGYTFNEFFDLQGELLVTQKGFRVEESTGFDIFNFPIDVGVDYLNRFTYFELPVLAKGKFGNDVVKGYAAVGPQIGLLGKGRSKANVNLLFPITIFDNTLNLENLGFNRFEFSAVGALGVEFNLADIARLSVEGRYSHGFTDFYSLPSFGTFEVDSDIRNQGFSGTVGLVFPLSASSGTKKSGGRF